MIGTYPAFARVKVVGEDRKALYVTMQTFYTDWIPDCLLPCFWSRLAAGHRASVNYWSIAQEMCQMSCAVVPRRARI